MTNFPAERPDRADRSWREEQRGLLIGVIGNVIGAIAGIGMYIQSRSDALLLDGLYTGALAGAALVAIRVLASAQRPRSRAYPFGASGQEPLYVLFQALVLLGMIVFAAVGASGKLMDYLLSGHAPVVDLDGLGTYFAAMVGLNLILYWLFLRSWRRSGGISDVLKGMSRSALFDAGVSMGTGLSLIGSTQLLHTPLAGMASVADSLTVLVLSALFLPTPIRDLRTAVAEAAGVSAEAPLLQRCGERLAPLLRQNSCTLVELAVIKLGRTYTVVAYLDPAEPLGGRAVDQLRQQVEEHVMELLQAPVLCEVIPTASHPYGSDQP